MANETPLTRQQIETLWVQAGGNPQKANEASAIAYAESGGRPNATNSNDNGTTDRGLWQINSIHGSLSTFDPVANARAAVQISQNGANWKPWCTAWSDGKCGGTFMGAGSPVLKFLGVGGSTDTPTFEQTLSPLDAVSPKQWANAFLQPIGVWLWAFTLFFIGGVLVCVGLWLLVRETRAGEVTRGIAGKGLSKLTFGVSDFLARKESRKEIES